MILLSMELQIVQKGCFCSLYRNYLIKHRDFVQRICSTTYLATHTTFTLHVKFKNEITNYLS